MLGFQNSVIKTLIPPSKSSQSIIQLKNIIEKHIQGAGRSKHPGKGERVALQAETGFLKSRSAIY